MAAFSPSWVDKLDSTGLSDHQSGDRRRDSQGRSSTLNTSTKVEQRRHGAAPRWRLNTFLSGRIRRRTTRTHAVP